MYLEPSYLFLFGMGLQLWEVFLVSGAPVHCSLLQGNSKDFSYKSLKLQVVLLIFVRFCRTACHFYCNCKACSDCYSKQAAFWTEKDITVDFEHFRPLPSYKYIKELSCAKN